MPDLEMPDFQMPRDGSRSLRAVSHEHKSIVCSKLVARYAFLISRVIHIKTIAPIIAITMLPIIPPPG